ncbi:MAG: hypothetical protein M3R65_10745 [Gemmatimonadota bacterium]|nr:hypothetical protein [Gemmatimonadota bacterium]
MSGKHLLLLSALSEYVYPVTRAATLRLNELPSRRKKRIQALQFVANSLCNAVASDRRYPNEVRRSNPEGGHLFIDILARRCRVNDSDVETIGVVHRLGPWLDGQLGEAGIRGDRISAACVHVDYTAADRTYLLGGRVWEMRFSLRAEIVSQNQSFVATAGQCAAAVPYGSGSIALW